VASDSADGPSMQISRGRRKEDGGVSSVVVSATDRLQTYAENKESAVYRYVSSVGCVLYRYSTIAWVQ